MKRFNAVTMALFLLDVATFTLIIPPPAVAQVCTQCSLLEASLAKLNARRPGAIDEVQNRLAEFQFSKKREIRQKEIMVFVRMASVAILLDDSGDSDSYFYNAYSEYPKEFDQALQKLPRVERLRVMKSLKDTMSIMREGNG